MKIVCVVFMLQFIVLLFFFIMNRRNLKMNLTYIDVVNRLHWILYIVPLVLVSVVGMSVTYFTGSMSSGLIGMFMLPIVNSHWVSDPLVLRTVFTTDDMRSGSFRNMIVKGVRSRILTIGICVNVVMAYYAFVNAYAK